MSNPFDQFDAPAGPTVYSKPGSGISVEVGGDQGGIPGMVRAEAQRQGVDPELALRMARQESRFNPNARSPAGAQGVMQLMPATAQEMGVQDALDPAQNIRGGVGYLKRQLDAFGGDPRLAAAAYNAGPGRVRAAGGVPNIPETQNYVDTVAPAQANPFDQFDGGQAEMADAGIPPEPAAAPPRQIPQAVQEAASGFAAPFANLGHDVADIYRRRDTQIGDVPRVVNDVAAIAGAPLQAAIRPLAGAISRALPAPSNTHTEWHGIIPHKYVDGQMTPDQARGAVEGDINTALQGARAAGVRLPAAQAASAQVSAIPGKNLTQQVRAVTPQMPAPAVRPQAVSLPELKTADDAAWAKVDASGYRFPKKDVQTVAKDVRQIVNDAGPELYPEADRVARRIEALSKRGDLSPAQANRLRSQVGEKLLQPGSTEASIGGAIKSRIDTLIDTANDPSLAQARALHTRYLKTREVTQRLEDAGLNQASAGTGGNANAVRQALKPLVKNKSGQRMRNATPAEMKALKNVVQGTPGQNLLRAASALDPFHGKIGAMFQTGLGIKTGGLSLATIPLGMAATAGERAIGQRNLQALIDLLSSGGKAAPAKAAITPRGLIGGGVLAAPAARQSGSRR